MGVLRVQDFAGIIPVSGDRALPDNFATQAVNTWLYGKELAGINPPIDLIACNATTKKVFRVPRRTVGGDPTYPSVVPPPSFLGDSVWLQFLDPDTDIVKGQLVEDTFERYYFCSPSTGLMFNTYARMQAGQSAYKVGVPGPNIVYDSAGNNAAKPTVTSITGGAAPVLTRAFVYTWVNEFGEESAPSLPVTAAGNANGIWNIGNITDPPAPAANQPNWSKKYLYRTITGTSGQTTYYRVNTIPLGTLTYADDGSKITDAVLANNLTLESTNWQPPPANLQGIIAMPNGFLIGFDKYVAGSSAGNNIYMSEAYHFHAWPAEYKYSTETPIVGLGVLGQTCVVATQGFPATVTGSKPATCSFTKASTGEPCLSRGSIVSTPRGVIYASQNGLMMVGPGGIDNITQQLITKEEWGQLYSPQYLRAVRYQNGYLALRAPPSGNRSAFYIDPTDLKVALTELSDLDSAVSFNNDFWSGEIFLLMPSMIRHWDPPGPNMAPVIWKSKEFQYPFKENFAVYAIYWDDARFSNDPWGASSVMPVTEHVHFTVYAGRNVVYDQTVPKNGAQVRLGSGFKSDIWQFEIRSRAPIYSLHVASTAKELKGV
jgi:hypothetical protein